MENTQKIIIQREDTNAIATAALVLGIIGLVIGIIPFIGWFMLPLWILAIVFGYLGRKKTIKQGLATTGMVLGIITFVYKFGFWIILIAISAVGGDY